MAIDHGAFANFGGFENDVSPDKIYRFERMAERKMRVATFSNNWGEGIIFPYAKAVRLNSRGITPLIRMMPRTDFKADKPDPNYSLDSILYGAHDRLLQEWARDCQTFGHRVIVDFACEANGTWFPWSKETPKLYVDAFRRIYTIIKAIAPKTEFVWHVNHDPVFENVKKYFPGNEFIDYVGASIYGNYYPRSKPTPYKRMAEITYGHLDILSPAPRIVSETGVTEGTTPEDKPQWISDFFDYIVKSKKYSIVSWWHSSFRVGGQKEDTNYRIDSTPASLEAYRAAASSPEIT